MTNRERARQRQLRRGARRAFEPSALRWFCTADERDFARYGEFTDLGLDERPVWTGQRKGKDTYRWVEEERFYIHKDNGASVLGVAHLDTVQDREHCYLYNSNQGPIVASPALDDRLGAYVICHLLPACGIRTDWLLTTGEESCHSTAADFRTTKDYDWVFSFDRRGTDVVMYDYETAENRARLAEVGAPVGDGSYSDIGDLDHLGVAGFNWGVGYRDYHSSDAWANLNDTFLNVGRFLSFHEHHAGERIEHIARPKWWEETEVEEDDGELRCLACGAALVDEWCENCGIDWASVPMGDVYRRRAYGLNESDWKRIQEEEEAS